MSLWLPDDFALSGNPELLKESLDRYRRVLDGSGYAFWEWGLHDNSYRCGGSFWEKLGYTTVDEAVTCVENVQEYVHPDDFKMVYEVVLNHLRFNTPIDMIYRIRAKNGDYWWTQACASSTRDEDGRVTFLSGVNFDLSHLKDTEKALRLSEARHERILAASNDGIWEWSVDDRYEGGRFHTSHSCWAGLGYTAEEVDSLPENEQFAIWASHLHPHDLVKLKRALRRHFTLKKPFDIEYRLFGQEGKMFWVRSRGQAIFNGKGRAILMSGINIDITELKEAEERVRKAKDDAEYANQAKSNFLSSMSHELRTPLNAIMGFSQLAIHDGDSTGEQRSNARQIYNAGEHLLQLINDVLDLAKIEAGKVSLDIEPVSPKQIIDECFELVRPLALQRSIQLSCDEGFDHIYIHADKTRLKQCLLNLLSNAVKYNCDKGEVNIRFKELNQQFEIAIEDTGDGISDEKQRDLFQPFNRLGAEKSTVEGSGIGLVITKELIEKMQGNIRYSRRLERGSCFKVHMPLADVSGIEAPSTGYASMGESTTLKAFSRAQYILYIEDHPSNIRLMREVLKPYSQLHLVTHSDPFVGLYHARTQLPDVIVLDINLPGISGLDLVKILKQDKETQHIPVIALSANVMPHDIERGKQCGFDEYLTKPLEIDKLLAALNHFLIDQAA